MNPQMRNGGGRRDEDTASPGDVHADGEEEQSGESEQAETTVTVPDHDISGVVLQFSPIPSIPIELIVDTSATSDNTQPDSADSAPVRLMLQRWRDEPEQRGFSTRPTPRRDQSFVFTAPPGSYHLQGRNTGTWYIKSATYGDSDLLREDLVVVPGAAGTPIRVVVSDETGSLQGTVNLNGMVAACWVYLIPTGAARSPSSHCAAAARAAITSAHLPPGSYQAIAFERRHSANYRDPASLAPFNSHVHSVTINAGDKPTLNLDAVPVAEVTP